MRDEFGRISFAAIGMMALLFLVLGGVVKARELLFWVGFNHPTKEAVEAAVKREHQNDTVTCYKTTGGDWDYICDHLHLPVGREARTSKHKWGVVTHWLQPVGSLEGLVIDGPTPRSREENQRRLREISEVTHRRNQSSRQPVVK